MIEELNTIEKRYKANYETEIKALTFRTEDIFKSKEILQNPAVNLSEITKLIRKVRNSVSDIQEQIETFKSDLLMDEIIVFESHDSIESFGKLFLDYLGLFLF